VAGTPAPSLVPVLNPVTGAIDHYALQAPFGFSPLDNPLIVSALALVPNTTNSGGTPTNSVAYSTSQMDFHPVPDDDPDWIAPPVLPLPNGTLATHTVFGADTRKVFKDASFPWSTVGRVATSGGFCTGTMVGRRLMMTASHCVPWKSDGTFGPLSFSPAYFNGPNPKFGTAWAVEVYYYEKVVPPTETWDESASDEVVIVLDRNIGTLTGWMGSKTFDNSWEGPNYWTNVGYPGDLTGTLKPVRSTGSIFDTDNSFWFVGEVLETCMDITPGHSGGPLFGFWSGVPHVVGVTVAGTPGATSCNNNPNVAAGGHRLPDLIIQALGSFPN